ncbi:cysteine desulfurase-like protein [Streptomyces lavendulae subsp. lavendulae]|uniref:aminotransferase class V-fold PLP-dependent enzyme n=1 Tax=Streptomyces lavendulae TaxID=1914 RepID=UPI0024A4F157|nr:aminotransferase class V-fold PLP-dependent enzyme [Streptomyces lavendulae]GLV84823.1 cysteine desulfurase-like protein [Streptomyces lavendulae subsp. lavendulae]
MNPLSLLSRPLTELLALPLTEQFPGLRAGSARFDGPGGTLMHVAVRDAITAYLSSEHVANDHGAFPASQYSTRVAEWAADRFRALIGADAGEVVFGANMTTLTSTFLQGLAEHVGPGDELVVTELDHEANVAPWRALAAARGATVRVARMAQDGTLPVEAVTEQLSARTRWVAVTAASNALGATPDLPAISAAAHAVGARVYVDGVQIVAHRPVEVAAWGCDAFVTSPYKWYGPHCGALWLSDGVAGEVRVPGQVPSAGDEPGERLSLGTTNFEAVLGTGVAAEVLLGWDRKECAEREAGLTALLVEGLAADARVTLLGPAGGAERAGVVTFQVAGHSAEAVADHLARSGVSVWHGTFYASSAMRAVSPGEPDAVRAGISHYTTRDDVAQLVDAVAGLRD